MRHKQTWTILTLVTSVLTVFYQAALFKETSLCWVEGGWGWEELVFYAKPIIKAISPSQQGVWGEEIRHGFPSGHCMLFAALAALPKSTLSLLAPSKTPIPNLYGSKGHCLWFYSVCLIWNIPHAQVAPFHWITLCHQKMGHRTSEWKCAYSDALLRHQVQRQLWN